MRDTAWTAAEFDRRAPTYDDGMRHRRNAEHAARLLASSPGQRVLDLAIGTGLALRACAGDRIGVDISAGMLRVAAARPLYEKARDAEHIVLYTRCRFTGR